MPNSSTILTGLRLNRHKVAFLTPLMTDFRAAADRQLHHARMTAPVRSRHSRRQQRMAISGRVLTLRLPPVRRQGPPQFRPFRAPDRLTETVPTFMGGAGRSVRATARSLGALERSVSGYRRSENELRDCATEVRISIRLSKEHDGRRRPLVPRYVQRHRLFRPHGYELPRIYTRASDFADHGPPVQSAAAFRDNRMRSSHPAANARPA